MRGYIEVSHGVAVEFNPDSVPSIQWNHIDGPLLHMRSGEIHWLTIWERLRMWLAMDNEYTLERKHSPEFVRRWLERANAEFRDRRAPTQHASRPTTPSGTPRE